MQNLGGQTKSIMIFSEVAYGPYWCLANVETSWFFDNVFNIF